MRSLVARAARPYIAGPDLEDALAVCSRLAALGRTATLGYWNAQGEDPEDVASAYRSGLDALVEAAPGAYLSVKAPALRFLPGLLRPILARAAGSGTRVHFDSLGWADADRTFALLAASADGASLGCTLPGRWARSERDAEAAVASGWAVRVIKGQWEDPHHPHRDARAGFLEVVARLRGSAVLVGVATHDAALGREALRRLREAGTPCEVELLHGLPMRLMLAVAREAEVPVRVYVPYGAAWLPYALSTLRREPTRALWLLKDAVVGSFLGRGNGKG
ncbi:MAG TPA: proline dehydrogenase [Candidatus Eisenbacteria bacterium]